MRLTAEQRAAALHPGHAAVDACPGSGKTRTVIARLMRCIDDVRDTPRRVACITYTNTAVHEIEQRLSRFGSAGDDDYCQVSTIHSFCLNNILSQFFWRIPAFADGFTILTPDSDAFRDHVKAICAKYGLAPRASLEFELLGRLPNGEPITTTEISADAAREFWTRLEAEQALDFPNIVYRAYQLLHDWPSIAKGLACRFAAIIVDEFQDTSSLQVEILRLIAGYNHTHFFIVGDPNQSIFGFSGARPDLMPDFARYLGTPPAFPLTGNFRSSPPIIQDAESTLSRTPAMAAKGPTAGVTDTPIWVDAPDALTAITEFFLPGAADRGIPIGKTAILASSWFTLRPLGSALREYGFPVVGPGARPYKRRNTFALLAEQLGAYAEHPQPRFIRQAEREVFRMVHSLTGKPPLQLHSWAGRRLVCRILAAAKLFRVEYPGALAWLGKTASMTTQVLIEAELLPEYQESVITESVSQMRTEMEGYGIDVENLTVVDLGVFARPDESIKLLTIHGAKGREFDAVAIVDLHNGSIPFFTAKTSDELAAERRKLYVAITRARRYLVYVTDRDHKQNRPPNIPSRFLRELASIQHGNFVKL